MVSGAASAGWRFVLGTAGALILAVNGAQAQESDGGRDGGEVRDAATAGKGVAMDYGPFLSNTIGREAGEAFDYFAIRGIAIRLGREAAVGFDTETLRWAVAWKGSFLDLSRTHLTSYKGDGPALVDGGVVFRTSNGPGWAVEGDFSEPRSNAVGPLPRGRAHYKGMFRHGRQVVLHYTVGGTTVYELPGFEREDGSEAFTRTLRVGKRTRALSLLLWEKSADLPVDSISMAAGGAVARAGGEQGLSIGVFGAEGNPWRGGEGRLEAVGDRRIELHLAAGDEPLLFKVVMAPALTLRGQTLAAGLRRFSDVQDPGALRSGGPALWPGTLTFRGRRGLGTGAYVVDTIAVPEENPWRSWMRLTGHDFFSDGRAAVCTWNGDVWLVSGLDEGLEQVKWKRFAAGLYEPLGLKIVNDVVHVRGRDQITRLRDLNGNGEADHYENFNNDGYVAPSYHAFAMGLDADAEGNFYYTRCGHRADPEIALTGAMFKVPKGGGRESVVAAGFRAPNGLSVGPEGQLTTSDNQGNWTPTSRINLVKPGGFYGYVPHSGREEAPDDYDPPICWLPMAIDNSSGGQVWVTSDRWGPLEGGLLHTSYGRCSLFLVMMEEINGAVQGGVVQLPLGFNSGMMRGRFHPVDGQLYLSGLKGWQTSAALDAGFQRVRYTGQPLRLPVGLRVKSDGVEIEFSEPLDPESATDEQNYAVERWNYIWSEKYGSPEFSVEHPGQEGRDVVSIRFVRMGDDPRRVFLRLRDMRPVMQMRIRFRIKAADGGTISREIYSTVNAVPN